MFGIARYVTWLHTGWPAGTVEKLPEIRADGTTTMRGVRVVGDLTGVRLPILDRLAASPVQIAEQESIS